MTRRARARCAAGSPGSDGSSDRRASRLTENNPEGNQDMSNCIHASTSVAYTVDGRKATVVVETCDDCGEKVTAHVIEK